MAGYWMWYYGDYEIYHIMKVNSRREERGYARPAFWKQHVPYVSVKFRKIFQSSGGCMKAYFNGEGHIEIDGVRYPGGVDVPIPSGECTVYMLVSNPDTFPAAYVESDVCPGVQGWECNGFYGEFTPVGWNKHFDTVQKTPHTFPFEYETKLPVDITEINGGILYDFGTELFGYLNIENADEDESIGVFYGESRDEALDTEHSYITDEVKGKTSYRLRQRAFRYVFLKTACKNLSVSIDYEYLPLKHKGSFRCDNELYNRLSDIASHTFHLNCREGFLDGIKRDRWVWAGDAYQSAKINTYIFQDKEIEQRTALGLVGKKPVEQHLNTILDYSLLWLIGLYEHYMVYGDIEFLKRIYPIALEMLEFCETRINNQGFIQGKEDDWTFIDWADMDKTGAVCAEQMLLIAAYSAMADISCAIGFENESFCIKSEILKNNVNKYYWSEEKGAYIDSYESGKNNVTRHANIFAIMYDIASDVQKEKILNNVLENDSIPQITTPYFRGYELEALAKCGKFAKIESILDSYWCEMVKRGVSTLWEQFDPAQDAPECYGMYGEVKYDKSLCHAWGAGPVYIFGRYYAGVYPTSPGFATFSIEPHSGGLKSFESIVPIGGGKVIISLSHSCLRAKSTIPGGTLIWNGKKYDVPCNEEIIL